MKKYQKKKEEEILKLIPNKKASNEHIKEISEKMYENAMKKYIKNHENKNIIKNGQEKKEEDIKEIKI